MFLSIEPDILGNENNQTLANSSITPANIIPERYFPLLHPVPRAIPVKLIGAILIMPSFILLFSLFVSLIIQFFSGLLSSSYYEDYVVPRPDPAVYTMSDVHNG